VIVGHHVESQEAPNSVGASVLTVAALVLSAAATARPSGNQAEEELSV